MKHYFLYLCFLLMISSQSFGQQSHFIFLQAENHEPFYVLLNKKNYSASPIGYLILPKLANGEYQIRLGFPKDGSAEQDYILEVKDNDQGFLIKEFGEKGWGLFNLQSLHIQYAGEMRKRKADAIAKAEIKEKPSSDENINEKINTIKSTSDVSDNRKNELDAMIKWPVLLSQTKTDSGFVYQYIVNDNNIQDTIYAYIYTKNNIIPAVETKEKEPVELVENKAELGTSELPTEKKIAEAEPIKPIATHNKKEDTITISEISPIPNSNCKAMADDKDFFRLRKKMVAVEDVDEMIMIAKKALKEKCYTTDHIRNLTALFLNDAARYQFLDAAYPFICDSYNYNSLIDLLKNSYYIERFKAMVRK